MFSGLLGHNMAAGDPEAGAMFARSALGDSIKQREDEQGAAGAGPAQTAYQIHP